MILDVPVEDAARQPSKTWLLDGTGHIRQPIDGLDAVAQAACLAIQTQRYAHLIFSGQYGSELHTLVGGAPDYVLAEAKRMVCDALRTDARITEVRDFSLQEASLCGETILSFTLCTIFGEQKLSIGGMRG